MKRSLVLSLALGLIVVSAQNAFAYREGSSVERYSSSSGSKLKSFLAACAYGTAAGGIVGAATLAFSNDPTNNLQNIAKGASLGLYAGVIYGAVAGTMEESAGYAAIPQQPVLAVSPVLEKGKMGGVQVTYLGLSF